jgi:hypothetical protein
MIMPLRKFGIEHGTVEVDQEDPQGLSRTAMSRLAAAEPAEPAEAAEAAPEAEGATEADEAHPEGQ